MQTRLHTRAELWGFTEALKAVATQHFDVPSGKFNEAIAAGFGKRTQAALFASLDGGRPADRFDHSAFVSRLSSLMDEESADAVGALLDGIQLDIEIVKYSERRTRAHHYSDIAYDISALVRNTGLGVEAAERSAKFLLPQFNSPHGEPYRVDSAHTHRHADDFPVSRLVDKRLLIVACLRDLRWEGGLFIYSLHHQADDANCLKSVKAALARKILPAVSPRIRCQIFRPDHYDERARRVEISLGHKYSELLNGAKLQFSIPKLSYRMVHIDKGYMGNDVHVGRLVDGQWFGDVYSNGIDEASNPTSIKTFRAALLLAVHDSLRRYGLEV